jgi:enoyl-CoA hydratase/carnithine racemase
VGQAAELAMSCRHRVLATTAELGRVTGGDVLLSRRIPAAQALHTGLVDQVVPRRYVLPAAIDLASACKTPQVERNRSSAVATAT